MPSNPGTLCVDVCAWWRDGGRQGGTTWTLSACVDDTPDVIYRRAWSMAVHGGRLHVGTLPSGKVW